MKYVLVKLLVFAALLASAAVAQNNGASPVAAPVGRNVSLVPPAALRANDRIWLQLKVGNLTKGSEIEIWTVEGRFLGSISPFGPASRDPRDAATYIVPIPQDAVNNKCLELRLVLNGPNNVERAPTKQDVRRVKLKITPGGIRP